MLPAVNLLLIALFLQTTFHSVSSNVCGETIFSVDSYSSEEYDDDLRVFGGSHVGIAEWPFLAALHYTVKSEFFCGGTLITAQNVLTGV